MFGLSQDEQNGPEELFELEEAVSDPQKKAKKIEYIRDRMLEIKKLLQSGESSETFQKVGMLLYGYVALMKVVERVKS